MSQPPFIPQPGQIDYTNIRWTPVINCLLQCGDRFLVVQRSQDLRLYPGCWNGVSGFLDDQKSLEDKVREELHEELGMPADHIGDIHLGQIFLQEDPQLHKSWIVHPILVQVTTQELHLDWEASDYRWLTLEEIQHLPLLAGFERVVAAIQQIVQSR